MEREYWVQFKVGKKRVKLGPMPSRTEALALALTHDPLPTPKTLYTGYGVSGAYFDIRWHDGDLRAAMNAGHPTQKAAWEAALEHGCETRRIQVEGGDTPEDRDTGYLVNIVGDQATVAWSSGVRTTQHISMLRAYRCTRGCND